MKILISAVQKLVIKDIILEIQEKEREHDGNLLQSHKLERH